MDDDEPEYQSSTSTEPSMDDDDIEYQSSTSTEPSMDDDDIEYESSVIESSTYATWYDTWDHMPMVSENNFQQSYRCYPLSNIQKSHLEGGNRIIMPQSALDRLASLAIQFPMMFEIKSHFHGEPISHCGVLEFTADEGFVFVPSWMMKNLKVEEGELVRLKSTELCKGTYMKIRPHKTEFIQLPNPKQVLEKALINFACLTTGDTIMICQGDNEFFFDVLETEPDKAISAVETDCIVDFEEPSDWKSEKVKKRKTLATFSVDEEKEAKKVQRTAAKEEIKFKAFVGGARRLDGQEVSKVKRDESAAEGGKGANMESKVELKPRKYAGKLVFCNEESENGLGKRGNVKEHSKEKPRNGKAEETSFQAFQGKNHSLTG